jgi:hypothetical protein
LGFWCWWSKMGCGTCRREVWSVERNRFHMPIVFGIEYYHQF